MDFPVGYLVLTACLFFPLHSWPGFLAVLLCGKCRSLFSWPRPGIRESLAKGVFLFGQVFSLWA